MWGGRCPYGAGGITNAQPWNLRAPSLPGGILAAASFTVQKEPVCVLRCQVNKPTRLCNSRLNLLDPFVRQIGQVKLSVTERKAGRGGKLSSSWYVCPQHVLISRVPG